MNKTHTSLIVSNQMQNFCMMVMICTIHMKWCIWNNDRNKIKGAIIILVCSISMWWAAIYSIISILITSNSYFWNINSVNCKVIQIRKCILSSNITSYFQRQTNYSALQQPIMKGNQCELWRKQLIVRDPLRLGASISNAS